MEEPRENPRYYFGYGSNLWKDQMTNRCPQSPFIGIARLPRHRWQINQRGYANVVQSASAADQVWGMVYALTPKDEAQLDVNEGVPVAYEKRELEVDLWNWQTIQVRKGAPPSTPVKASALVYMDFRRTRDGDPKPEYVYRLNQGIRDALKEGMDAGYVETVLRRFIPDRADERAEGVALRQARRFVDDNTL